MAKNDAEAPDQEPKKKSPLVKILALVFLVVLLGAGGYVGWMKFGGGGGEAPDGKAEINPVIHPLETFLVNLLDTGSKRYLKVDIQLKVNGPEAVAQFTEREAELRDIVLMLLSNKESEDIATLGGKQALKREITQQINRALEKGEVLDVFFTQFLIQ